jgi:hypothetical protein
MVTVSVFGILLVAGGAVLFWGVDRTVSGVEVSTIGVIVMAVGVIGYLASLLLMARATPGRGGDSLNPLGMEAGQKEETRPFRRHPPQ